MCLLNNNFCKEYNRKNYLLYCALIKVKRRGKNVRIMSEFLVTTFNYNWFECWNHCNIGIACVLQSLFQSGLSCLSYVNYQMQRQKVINNLVNINESSPKDKYINLEPDEQSCNSKLVFPKTLNIIKNFQLLRF